MLLSENYREPELRGPVTIGFRGFSRCVVLAGCCLAQGMLAPAATAQGPMRFEDVTGSSGISFRHTDGSSGSRYLVEAVSGGLALFDFDTDGDTDIYFLNGGALKGTHLDVPPRNALYRNDGGFVFTNVTDQAGVGDTAHGLGVAVGDLDNDGYPDLYLNNFGLNVCYRNNGDGTFSDVTRQTGTDRGAKVGAGTCFLDMDADGDLDLYVANYIQFSYDVACAFTYRGVPYYPGPRAFAAESDNLFRNNGDLTFTDVSIASGIAAQAGYGMGMVCCDFDADADTDIFVCNDTTENFLFENDGHGRFAEVGTLAGVAYDYNGETQGSMGADCGDFNRDGLLDIYQTGFQREEATLYENLGRGLFEDVSRRTGAGAGTFNQVEWGAGFGDFDNDGDPDIYVACGHLYDNVEQFDDSTSYRARNLLLMNTGDGKFSNVSNQCGGGLLPAYSSRGMGLGDLDKDGRLDVVVLNSREQATALRNVSPGNGHWLGIRLIGIQANRDGVGAQVKVVGEGFTQVAEVHSGRGYQSHYGTQLHFGLGPRARVERIEIRWIGGHTDVIPDVGVDRIVMIREGS